MSLLTAVESALGKSPAVTPAVQPFNDPVDLVNAPAGEPAQNRWPGAIDPAEHSATSTDQGVQPGMALPASETYGDDPFGAGVPHETSGGGYQDTAWQSGHDGPQLPWDSSAGAPFLGSGPVDPELHGTDTGGVYVKEHVAPAHIGKLIRHTGVAQTTIRTSGSQTERDFQTQPNDRLDLDQQQWHDPGFPNNEGPYWTDYSERPIYNNVAYESMPIEQTGSTYTPDGTLPNRSTYWSQTSGAYESPNPPDVTTAAPASSGSPMSNGWTLG